MSEKRRDSRGRLLHNGEVQLSDGRYRYKYTDPLGMEKYVYSTRLEHSDPVPTGRRRTSSLRELERKIQANLYDHIISDGGNTTVLELVEKYVSTRTSVRPTTAGGYRTVLNMLRRDPMGLRRIDTVRISDAKCWMIKLQAEGRGYSSIHTIRGVLKPAFQMAVDDDLIRKNPFGFYLADVVVNDSVTREALTSEEKNTFLQFVKEDSYFSRYYDGIYILLNTGLRISEFCGLTVSDIDFKEHSLRVDHQLQKKSGKYYIEETKTLNGTRKLPLTPDVEECFHRIVARRKPPKTEPMVDGKTGFLYYDKDGGITYALHWEHYFKHIREKYNKNHKIPLPVITPHVCRHTYCSNMAKSGMNPKTLQYLMGHADISVTLNVYTHVKYEDAKAEIEKLHIV